MRVDAGLGECPPLRRSSVEGAADSLGAAVQDVGIGHGRFHVAVAEAFLDCTNTCPERRCWVS